MLPHMQTLPWIIALATLALLVFALAAWALTARRPKKVAPLPTEWALAARPVFSTDERRVYRLLREALPHHIVLSKLPLVRFCQPTDPGEVRYWLWPTDACLPAGLAANIIHLPEHVAKKLLAADPSGSG